MRDLWKVNYLTFTNAVHIIEVRSNGNIYVISNEVSSSRDGPSIKTFKGSRRSSILRMSGEPDGGITHSEEVVRLSNIWEWDSEFMVFSSLESGCSEGWRKIRRIE
ncbi:hypothetical protein CEXT_2091 [Caerostris extrusa]|uniref:Uncharacterized protein n=1 Tax=Caerostris extrusa TaxID=172846 RepID=A0AAV4UYY8_CAEEX|nr:hypothetical protein CEXT_2091 [Caerostris extrusa]